ncbi:tryptophan-rich sensory protein [Patescibacteria group bacterium]|nr:tryptophan-rich sensory protein [Patescibacteria group bacterium]
MKNTLQAIGFILVSQLAGIIGSVFVMPAVDGWYLELTKPSFNPPSWLFGPVWTLLYTLMGIAAFLVWKKGSGALRRTALTLFGAQLVANSLWSILFFALQSPGFAFLNIMILWVLIVATMVAFYRVSKVATLLMVPYILWVSFAAFLNYSIWILN